MYEWEMKVFNDHVVVNGKIGLDALMDVLENQCAPNWISCPEWADEVGANMVFCSRNAATHRNQNAVNQ